MIVYINEQGSQISISGERIILKKGGATIGGFLAKDVDQIVIMGNIGLSTQSIRFFLEKKIDVVFTTFSGKYLGRLLSEFGKNVVLRRLQFEAVSDEDFKVKISREILDAKFSNSINVIRKLNYYHKSSEVSNILYKLNHIKNSLLNATSIQQLLGVEGAFANLYFSTFDILLTGNLKFVARSRRPPENEINALLSFGYTILTNLVRTSTNLVGLDPYFGVYHVEDYGRPSLVLDLMEEFRSVAIDATAINAVNRNMINKADFVWNELDRDNEELPVKMTIYGRKKWLSILEKRFNSLFWYDYKNKKVSLKEIVRHQAYLMSKAFIEKKDYKGFYYNI